MSSSGPGEPPAAGRPPRLRKLGTASLTSGETAAIRSLLEAAFGTDEEDRFTDDDWNHAIGGVHFVLELDGRPVRTGYVEAVAVSPGHQGAGHGSMLMAEVSTWIAGRFELGALGTGRHRFYERHGWRTWRGVSMVRSPDGVRPTPEDDGSILVLATPSSPSIDLAGSISCDWRSGDVW